MIKVTDGRTKWIPVKTGRTADGKTEIFGDGLTTGDTLVKIASEEIRDGAVAQQVRMGK